jgi:methyl-accepting chemotaxis protein
MVSARAAGTQLNRQQCNVRSKRNIVVRADEINGDVATAARETASKALVSTAVVLLIGILLSILYGALTARTIARPLAKMAGVMSQLAGGDEDARIPALERGDEIGDMARSLTTIRDTGVRAARIQTALENTASVVVMADLAGKIIYANQGRSATSSRPRVRSGPGCRSSRPVSWRM